MVNEARLDDVGSGLAPSSEGWFVVNAQDAAWLHNNAFGHRCVFEADERVLRGHPGREPHRFHELGITLDVISPGQPSGLYHAESMQEDFLVLAGECVLLVERQERHLRAWDFAHCPAGTEHVFIGAGDGPCVILMIGARGSGKRITYPRWDAAIEAGAGVEQETDSPHDAYAGHPHWRPGRPEPEDDLPWTRSER
jgi:uncharacterized cupin superfamily protein